MEIKELRSEAELEKASPIMRDAQRYMTRLADKIPAGYRLFALRESGGISALAGVQVLTDLYCGRRVYDPVAKKEARAKGYGEKPLSHVEEFGRREGRGYVALACGRERPSALRFYVERMRYERPDYSIGKSPSQDRHPYART